MGEKDITEKILEDHNDVFADIINGLIFAGEQRILPESLENTAVHSQYKADDEKVHELERDVAKYWKDQDVQLAICGIENQSSVEKYMPFRIIGYDGTAYRSQLQDKRKEILPVMTIVLYFGTEHCWYGKRNIKGLMKIPEGLDDYINDYKMQVFEVAWLTEEQISRFRSDFKIVANFFVQKRKNKDYIPDDPTEIKHIDEVLKLLQVMTGDEHYKEVIRKKKGNLPILEKNNDILKIVFVGRLIGKKGIAFLVDALSLMPDDMDWELLIFGDGDDRALIEKQIADSGIGKNVKLMGNRPLNQIAEAYQQADIFALPSLRETSGNVLLEAMAYAVPIVAFDTSFCKKLNKVECGVFVNTEQTLDGIKEDYCKAIVTLGRDKELAKQMGLNGYKYVNKYLTWETKYKVILKDFV